MARRVFSGPPRDQRVTPGQCVEAFHLQRTRFEMVAERKLRRRQLTEDGNVEITGRDLREKMPPVGQGSLFPAGMHARGESSRRTGAAWMMPSASTEQMRVFAASAQPERAARISSILPLK